MIRVLLVDDQPAVRQGLRMRLALETDVCVIGEAVNGAEAVVMAQVIRPDVAVIDVDMPGLDGLQAAEALRQLTPGTAVVMLSIHDGDGVRARARAAGTAAFVGKHEPPEALLTAIRGAALSVRPAA